MSRHHHPDRMAEVYRRDPTHTSGLRWIGYAADPPADATWSEQLQAWILKETAK
jgi:hypothetical protein